jgi:hypothetical protein
VLHVIVMSLSVPGSFGERNGIDIMDRPCLTLQNHTIFPSRLCWYDPAHHHVGFTHFWRIFHDHVVHLGALVSALLGQGCGGGRHGWCLHRGSLRFCPDDSASFHLGSRRDRNGPTARLLLVFQDSLRHPPVQQRHVGIFLGRRFHDEGSRGTPQGLHFGPRHHPKCQIRLAGADANDDAPRRYVPLDFFQPLLHDLEGFSGRNVVANDGSRCILVVHLAQDSELLLARRVPNLDLAREPRHLQALRDEEGAHRGSAGVGPKVALGESQHQRGLARVGVAQHDDLSEARGEAREVSGEYCCVIVMIVR